MSHLDISRSITLINNPLSLRRTYTAYAQAQWWQSGGCIVSDHDIYKEAYEALLPLVLAKSIMLSNEK